jgi:hypothetical protein
MRLGLVKNVAKSAALVCRVGQISLPGLLVNKKGVLVEWLRAGGKPQNRLPWRYRVLLPVCCLTSGK